MAGIPILQGAGGIQLGDGPEPEFLSATHAPGPGGVQDVVKREAGLGEQALAIRDFIAAGACGQHLASLGHHDGLQAGGERVFCQLFAERGFCGFREPQPWMGFLRQIARC